MYESYSSFHGIEIRATLYHKRNALNKKFVLLLGGKLQKEDVLHLSVYGANGHCPLIWISIFQNWNEAGCLKNKNTFIKGTLPRNFGARISRLYTRTTDVIM